MWLALRRIIYALLSIILLAIITLGLIWKIYINSPLPVHADTIIYVPPGSSMYSVAKKLEKDQIVTHPIVFMLFAMANGKQKSFIAGEYLLTANITPRQLINKFIHGKVYYRRYTIIEGWNIKQVLNSINTNPYLHHTINNLSPDDISKQLGLTQNNFEGYLFPDTYFFSFGAKDIIILKKAHRNMQQKLDKLWQNRAQNLPYDDPYSALIVASLIEKETAKKEERTKIAGVIQRRLQLKMPLQIDAAVIYGLGNHYRGKLTRADLKIDSPYNTYLHKGLPPTPISMPSLPSIEAALHPESGTALYYVARGDGYHEFTDSFQAHLAAIKKYRVDYLDFLHEPSEDSLMPVLNKSLNSLDTATVNEYSSIFGVTPSQ